MTENAEDLVLTKRNHKLLNIANICEIAAWLTLGGYIIFSYFHFVQIKSFSVSTCNFQLDNRYFERINENPFVVIKIAIDVLINIMKGVVGFLVLYGISNGLKMLVETEVNYRLNMGEK